LHSSQATRATRQGTRSCYGRLTEPAHTRIPRHTSGCSVIWVCAHTRTSTSSAKRVDPRRTLGQRGERIAANHLHRQGFSSLGRNERTRHGEIDVIAFDGHTLVFAEVKTRRVGACANPSRPGQEPVQFLRPRQLARLRKLAAAWLADPARVRPTARTIRFDAIGVTVDSTGRLIRLDHIEGAW
jgi:putative endonuclease